MADPKQHPRLILSNFLSPDLCKELEFIHKSSCTVGYRPNVFSTTLSHLIATNCPHLIIPFVSIRERLKEKVEEFFGCEYELCVEFTGLISWCRGASIGWHSDDNRPYLKQRDFAVVCYLNSQGVDFSGGNFHFQEGEPTTIVPKAGDVVMYTADSRNIHSVDEITDGERLTLTMWFSRDSSHDEDAKLISFLSQKSLDISNFQLDLYLPMPASTYMYWFPPGEAPKCQLGFDIRYARMHICGFDLYSSQVRSCSSASNLSCDFSELVMEPLQLAWGDELFDKEFINILHALQVVQFFHWKESELHATQIERQTDDVMPVSQLHSKKIHGLRLALLKDCQLADTLFSGVNHGKSMQHVFNWARFSAALFSWEAYTSRLCEELLTSLQYWQTHQFIFSVPVKGPEGA